MRYIVIADIHSNIQALDSVVRSFSKLGGGKIICAGDIVGYGANPNECIEKMVVLGAETVLGNHDSAVLGRTPTSYFNEYAARALEWTKGQVAVSHFDYLNKLPLVIETGDLTLVHGTLHEPGEFNYMLAGSDAMHTFECMKNNICFVGHSHVPGIFAYKNGKIFELFKREIRVEPGVLYIVNVGSVGQPRDRDNRACYCVYDTDRFKLKFYRVDYDVKTARSSIINAGLPVMLGDRLLTGR
ncbi:MAG: metallophosphoesterase family protein [Candidatus Omnitrophica bacterium]|nr:metallophosphoesterase family protein [Candidatus Omnitrophota bacterium]